MSFRVSGSEFWVSGFEFRLRVCHFNPKPENYFQNYFEHEARNSELF
jgi:hypothetical protein